MNLNEIITAISSLTSENDSYIEIEHTIKNVLFDDVIDLCKDMNLQYHAPSLRDPHVRATLHLSRLGGKGKCTFHIVSEEIEPNLTIDTIMPGCTEAVNKKAPATTEAHDQAA